MRLSEIPQIPNIIAEKINPGALNLEIRTTQSMVPSGPWGGLKRGFYAIQDSDHPKIYHLGICAVNAEKTKEAYFRVMGSGDEQSLALQYVTFENGSNCSFGASRLDSRHEGQFLQRLVENGFAELRGEAWTLGVPPQISRDCCVLI